MSGLTSTLAGALLVAVVLSGSAGAAAVPPGPQLASVALIETKRPGRDDASSMSVQTLDPNGRGRRVLIAGALEAEKRVSPAPFHGPGWSADGSLVVFAGTVNAARRIYVVGADGTGLRAVPGTKGGYRPVVSPDGHTVAFVRQRFRSHVDVRHPERSRFYSSVTTWVTDLSGGGARRLTRWRNGLANEPSSFSPDGSTLALTKSDDRLDGPRVVLARLDGSVSTELVQLAEEAAFSPDGSRLAFVGYAARDVVEAEENQDYSAGELYTINVDKTGLRRLTRTDDVLESAPSWDPSGQRLAYVRAKADTSFVPVLGMLFPTGNSIMQINADGTCATKVASRPEVAFYGAVWQPGVGRGVAPLAC